MIARKKREEQLKAIYLTNIYMGLMMCQAVFCVLYE